MVCTWEQSNWTSCVLRQIIMNTSITEDITRDRYRRWIFSNLTTQWTEGDICRHWDPTDIR
jgi:hypothetical protein